MLKFLCDGFQVVVDTNKVAIASTAYCGAEWITELDFFVDVPLLAFWRLKDTRIDESRQWCTTRGVFTSLAIAMIECSFQIILKQLSVLLELRNYLFRSCIVQHYGESKLHKAPNQPFLMVRERNKVCDGHFAITQLRARYNWTDGEILVRTGSII